MKYTAVKCVDCESILYQQDFQEEQVVATCWCGNVKMGTVVIEDSIYPWYVTVQYSADRPEIYETETREEQPEQWTSSLPRVTGSGFIGIPNP